MSEGEVGIGAIGGGIASVVAMACMASIAIAASVNVDKDGNVSCDEKLFEEIYKALVGAYIPGTPDQLDFQSIINNVKANRTRVTKDQLEEMFSKYGYFLKGKVDDDMVNHVNFTLNKYIVDGCTDDAKIKNRIRNFLAQGMHESNFGFIEEGSEAYIASKNYQGGSNYRGVGFIQVTHLEAYQKFTNSINDQEVVKQGYKYVAEKYPWEIGGFWWKDNTMNKLVDNGATMKQVGNAVNKGRGAWNSPSNPYHEDERERAYKVVNEVIK
jgi:predicted chitinase